MAEPLNWTLLPENGEERAMFDRGTQLHGDVRVNIANILRIFAVAHPGGSYADQCRIMANEVAKLELPSGVAGVAPTELWSYEWRDESGAWHTAWDAHLHGYNPQMREHRNLRKWSATPASGVPASGTEGAQQ